MIERWVVKKYLSLVRLSAAATAKYKGEITNVSKKERGSWRDGSCQQLFKAQLTSMTRLCFYQYQQKSSKQAENDDSIVKVSAQMLKKLLRATASPIPDEIGSHENLFSVFLQHFSFLISSYSLITTLFNKAPQAFYFEGCQAQPGGKRCECFKDWRPILAPSRISLNSLMTSYFSKAQQKGKLREF